MNKDNELVDKSYSHGAGDVDSALEAMETHRAVGATPLGKSAWRLVALEFA